MVKAEWDEKSRCSAHMSDKINDKDIVNKLYKNVWNQAINDTRNPGKMNVRNETRS